MTKLGTKMLCYGLIMAWLPLGLFGAFVSVTVKAGLEAAAAERTGLIARNEAASVNYVLLQVAHHLEATAAADPDLWRLPRQPGITEAMLFDLLKIDSLLEDAYLFDMHGQAIRWVSRRRLPSLDTPETIRPEPGKTPFIAHTQRESDGRLTAIIGLPLPFLPGSQPAGYLGGKVSLRGVTDQVSREPAAGQTFIVDRDGRLIGHQDFSQVLQKQDVTGSLAVQLFSASAAATAGETLAAGLAENTGPAVRYRSYSGKEVLGAYSRVGHWGWAVVVEQDVSQALATVYEWQKRLVLVGGIVSILAFLLSLYLSRRITKPVAAIEAGLSQIAQGNWNQALPYAGQDEIGRLAAAFNRMLSEQKHKKELENRLSQSDKMATIGTMAASIAHEINNPLAVISGYSEDLLDRYRDNDPQALSDLPSYLNIILEQTKRCKKITQSLLDTARMPAGTTQWVSIGRVIASVREILLFRANKKGVSLEPLPPLDQTLTVRIDPVELQQIFLNLLVNALDACSAGDRILIDIRRTGESCCVQIKDSGAGIEPEHLVQLGQSFFTTKPPGQGTGLGLYLVKQILTRYGGSFHIHSDGRGKGSIAAVILPLSKEFE